MSQYGLTPEALHAALTISNGAVELLHTTTREDGLVCRTPGGELHKLAEHGFITIEPNGRESIARVTVTGLKALAVRSKRFP